MTDTNFVRTEVEGYGRWLVSHGYLSQDNFEAGLVAMEREAQGETPNSQATYTEANEREFAELCEQYSKKLEEVDDAETNVQMACHDLYFAQDCLALVCGQEQDIREKLKAYKTLFGFTLPAGLVIPEYVCEVDIPF